MLEPRIVISDDPKFVYFRIPKAANTTVMATIYGAFHGNADISLKAMNSYKESFRRPHTLSQGEVDGLTQTHILFSVVRNPYNRFLSAYLEKIAGARAEKQKVSKALDRTVDAPISIEDFLDYLDHRDGLAGDPHWARQSDIIAVGIERLHRVIRVERIVEELPPVMALVFGRTVPVASFQKQTVTGADSKAAQLLTDSHRERIYRLYEADFRALGYPA